MRMNEWVECVFAVTFWYYSAKTETSFELKRIAKKKFISIAIFFPISSKKDGINFDGNYLWSLECCVTFIHGRNFRISLESAENKNAQLWQRISVKDKV